MDSIISALIGQYENGKLTRRDLVAGLAALAAAPRTAKAQGLRSARIDHVSLQVRDLRASRDFYSNVLGLAVVGEGGPENTVRLGQGRDPFLVLRHGTPTGTADHLALRLEAFDKGAVTRTLRAHGLTPIDATVGAGYHIKDPDGFRVQLV